MAAGGLTVASPARDIADMDKVAASRTSPVEQAERSAAPFAAFRSEGRWSVVFLAYLPFYFISWLFRRPGQVELIASLVCVVIFLALFWKIFRDKGRPKLWTVCAIFSLGLVLSPFKAGWSVYTIYAMAFAARMGSRRLAVRTMIAMEAVLLLLGPFFLKGAWPIWGAGVVFGAITGFAVARHLVSQRETLGFAVPWKFGKPRRSLAGALFFTLSKIVRRPVEEPSNPHRRCEGVGVRSSSAARPLSTCEAGFAPACRPPGDSPDRC